jgi:hypothetical protein
VAYRGIFDATGDLACPCSCYFAALCVVDVDLAFVLGLLDLVSMPDEQGESLRRR